MDYLDIPYSAAFNQDFGLGDYNYSDFGGFSGSFVPPTSKPSFGSRIGNMFKGKIIS